MNADALNSLILSGQPHLLIDVLTEDVHAAQCIPGSVNVCVHEMTFVEKVAELAPSRDTVIVVYGAGEGSHDSKTAAAKLKAAGYSNVMELPAGIAGWQAAGLPVRGHGRLPQAPQVDGCFAIDTAESVIRWTGRNLFNHHHGTVRLAGGEIDVAQGVLRSARFDIDMKSIACEDLTDSGWNAMLLRHLHDSDFFETSRFPTAIYTVRNAEAVPGCTEGTPNFQLHGELSLRGVTRPLGFPVVIASTDGTRLTGQAQFEIDRTEFGSIYGSGKFFRYLGKHIVNDHIHLHVRIHADAITRQ